MRNKNTKLPVIACFILALIAMMASFILLGQRNDGERITFPNEQKPSQDMTQASFDSPVNGKVALFVCAPEKNRQELEALTEIDIQTVNEDDVLWDVDRLTLTAPMPLEIPTDFAQKNALPNQVVCSDSELVNLDAANPESLSPSTESSVTRKDATRKIDIPSEAFVVAAVSEPGSLLNEKSLFFAFLFSIWIGIALLSKKIRLSACRFKRYDFLLAFGGGNLFAMLLLEAIAALPFETNSLLPGYDEMLAMLIVNFVGFLLTAVFFVWLRQPRQSPWFRPITSTNNSLSPKTTGNTPAELDETKYNPSDDLLPLSDKEDKLCSKSQVSSESETTSSQKGSMSQMPDVPVNLIYPVILGIGLAIVGTIVVFLLVKQPGLTTFTMASQLISTLFITGIFAILAAISEESVFRGIIQSSLEAKPNSKNPMMMNILAIAVASLLFVGMHVPQSIDHPWALLPIAAVSITSGILKIHYQTIFPCILLHMTYNATLVVPGILIA